jgi:hypothetical protein
MPRFVRNYWLSLDVEGRRTPLATGPRSKNGGFHLTIAQSDAGAITFPLTITGEASEDGSLTLSVLENAPTGTRVLYEHITQR